MLLKSIIVIVLLVTGSFIVYTSPHAEGSSDFVTSTSTNTGDKTVIEVNNSASSTSDVFSLILEINGGSFKSFKLENGWIGKKTSATAVAFISSSPIKPGNSAKFENKTDQQNPSLTWKAIDANNNEIDTDRIGNDQNKTANAQVVHAT